MLSDLLNRVESQLSSELPFVIYRKPNANKINTILQKDNQLYHTQSFTESGFLFAPFDVASPAVLIQPDEQIEVDFTGTKRENLNLDNNDIENQGQKEFHLNLVEKGIEQIKKGAFEKVVLSRKLEVGCNESPLKLFHKLISNYKSAFCYLWYHPKVGMWLGATPEILLRVENNRLTTMSLAGTQAYTGQDNPSWGQKELTEQLMVTEYITKALKNDVSEIMISEVQSVRAGNLWHLRTKITATIQNNLTKIIQLLHPTPAVCGMPMEAAKKFILAQENYNREYYTGFLGELNLKHVIERTGNKRNQENKSYKALKTTTELFVNLRCMQLKNNSAVIYVGGGITKDSDSEKEWYETMAKSNTMMGILAKT